MHDGYKTYLVALIAIVCGVIQTADITKLVADPKAGLTAIGMGVLMGIMRYVTQQTTVKVALMTPPPAVAPSPVPPTL